MSYPVDMRLQVLTPSERVVDERTVKIVAEATNGSFALLPRHIDYVAPLTAGVLTFTSALGREQFLGVDEGFLVKCAGDVRVSTRRAVVAPDLDQLRARIRMEFEIHSERTMAARSALARLELSLIRRFIELEHGT